MNYICSEIVRYKVFFILPKIHFVREKILTSKVKRKKKKPTFKIMVLLGYEHQLLTSKGIMQLSHPPNRSGNSLKKTYVDLKTYLSSAFS